ncbi:MAG: helix-turn-helix domain-containing protein [[Clostridium] innocuum]
MTYRKLRDLREDYDLSQEQLAKYLNVSQRTYSYYETGNRNIPVEILAKLAKFYNTTIEYLISNGCTK